MNRAWMALAGLVALGAAAAAVTHFLQQPPERLRTVTGPLSARECADWRAQAERFERRRAGWFAVYEGFALLQGVCLPKDEARGRALIEGAFAAGLDEMLVLPYTESLAMSGDIARSREWAFLAVAANQLHMNRTNNFYTLRDFHMRLALDPRTRVGSTPEEWDFWYPRIRAILNRPAILPKVESQFLNRTINDLIRIREVEGYLLLDEVRRSGRILGVPTDLRDSAINLATRCGDPTALRRRAQYYISDALQRPFDLGIVGQIAWLHARTGADAPLLAAVTEKAGLTPNDPRVESQTSVFEELVRNRCAEGGTSKSGSMSR